MIFFFLVFLIYCHFSGSYLLLNPSCFAWKLSDESQSLFLLMISLKNGSIGEGLHLPHANLSFFSCLMINFSSCKKQPTRFFSSAQKLARLSTKNIHEHIKEIKCFISRKSHVSNKNVRFCKFFY